MSDEHVTIDLASGQMSYRDMTQAERDERATWDTQRQAESAARTTRLQEIADDIAALRTWMTGDSAALPNAVRRALGRLLIKVYRDS